MHFGTVTGPLLNGVAQNLETLGYDAVLFTDSQCRAPEVWTALGAAAMETNRVLLGPGVTNTITRDPSVVACAAATLHMLSKGRAVLALGRGDTSAHFIGKKTEALDIFDAKVADIRRYLNSEPVKRGDVDSIIQWLPLLEEHGKVPIEMVPSGPKVAQIAAKHADRISFAIGADPDYIRYFIEYTKQQIEAAGREPASVKIGAWVNVLLSDDRDAALMAVRGTTGVWARFSMMRPDKNSLPKSLRDALGMLAAYDINSFGQANATSEEQMPDEFVDWFSIAGDAEYVQNRLSQLQSLGLDYLYLVPGQLGFQDQIGSESITRVASEVLPKLRALSGTKHS